MAGGRPTKYDPAMCEKVVELMSVGASKIEVSAEIGITSETLYDYCEKHPEFSDAVKRGEQLSAAWWERHGRQNLDNKEFNATLWYMNMKNRFKWSDRTESKQTVTLMTHEESLKELK